MAFALAKENEAFLEKMLKQGRFNNQGEIVREALRRMERAEDSYLDPTLLSEGQARCIYAPNRRRDAFERSVVRKSKSSIQRSIKSRKLRIENL